MDYEIDDDKIIAYIQKHYGALSNGFVKEE
jgi:hypothetical protein